MSIPASLEGLAKLLEEREHLLALGGDDQLSTSALAATKDIADLAISLEQKSHPHLHPFLKSILEPQGIELRSSTKKPSEEPVKKPEPEELLPYTPLSSLTTDGMEAEQVWAQLELRNDGLCKIVKEVGPGDVDPEDMEDMEEEEEESVFDEDDDEDMTEEEWKALMAQNGYEEGDSASGSENEEDESGSDSEGSGDEEEDEMAFGSDVSMGESEEGSDGSEGEDDEGDDDEEEEEEEEDDDEEEDGGDTKATASMTIDMDEGFDAGPSKPRARHPTLDDQFFSIDDFNRQTEEMEASRVTSGALGGDEDEDVDLEDVSSMFLKEADEDADIMFSDFFDAPRAPPKGKPGKTEGKKSSKGKKRSVAFADEDDDEQEDEDENKDPEAVYGTFDRVKADLFDDEEEEDDEQPLSTHERRQRELAEQIAQLESEAIGPKDWTLLGEATARARPENSLLEEDLDFEHVAKSVPQITEESVATLEELIKKRILDNNFDSPVRVRAYEPNAFLPSRFFELDDKQSAKSLAQIYEDEFQASASGGKVVDVRDEKLKKQHEEIDTLWNEVCYKLDALSSLNFVPKAPKAQITTIDNIATTTMETALPSSQAASTMLAPHELFAGPSKNELVARSEQTPEEAKAARGKARKHKKAERARLDATAQLYGKKRKTAREEKDEALKHLVKSGKGVTVLGKGSKEDAKRKQRDEAAPDAKRLKL